MLWTLKDGRVFVRYSPSKFSSVFIEKFVELVKAGKAVDHWGISYIDTYCTKSGFIYVAPEDTNKYYQRLLPIFGANKAFSLVTSYTRQKKKGFELTERLAHTANFGEALRTVRLEPNS